jgi:hypothetical protein
MNKFDKICESVLNERYGDIVPNRKIKAADITLPKEVLKYLSDAKFVQTKKKSVIQTFAQNIDSTYDDTAVRKITIDVIPYWATKFGYDPEKKSDKVSFKVTFLIKDETGEFYNNFHKGETSAENFGKAIHKIIDKEI